MQVKTAASRNSMNGTKPLGKAAPKTAAKKPLDAAMDKLRAAQDEALSALGIQPLSPVRRFINLLGSIAAAGGAYYLVMQITEAIVTASLAYFGVGFITFMVAFIGLCLALFACWQTYAVVRSTLDAVAMGTVTPAELARDAWDKVTSFLPKFGNAPRWAA